MSAPFAAVEADPGSIPTAIYIAGASTLEPGRRYGLRIDAGELQLLGPIEVDSHSVALKFDLRELDATSVGGRLLISRPLARSNSVLAFMSVTGTTPDVLAESIVEAVRAAGSA